MISSAFQTTDRYPWISSKLLEYIGNKHITDYLESNKFFSDSQHVFRRDRSTITQLTSTVHHLASVIIDKGQVNEVFIDFSKAFHTIPHDASLLKIRAAGVHNLTHWIMSYLSNRKQYVKIDGTHSFYVDVFPEVLNWKMLRIKLCSIKLFVVSGWCEKWQMKLNFQKTACITFTKKKSHLTYDYMFLRAF